MTPDPTPQERRDPDANDARRCEMSEALPSFTHCQGSSQSEWCMTDDEDEFPFGRCDHPAGHSGDHECEHTRANLHAALDPEKPR